MKMNIDHIINFSNDEVKNITLDRIFKNREDINKFCCEVKTQYEFDDNKFRYYESGPHDFQCIVILGSLSFTLNSYKKLNDVIVKDIIKALIDMCL